MNNYYLYQHIRLDKNQVFYIGVGTIQTIRNKLISQVCNGNKKQTHGYRFQFK